MLEVVAARRSTEEVWKEIFAIRGLSAPVPSPAGGGSAETRAAWL
jgi:hypothetical protein